MESWMSSFVRKGYSTEADSDASSTDKTTTEDQVETKSGYRQLEELCLPGSHNSHAYVTRSRLLPSLVREWILCQSHDVLRQLKDGIRLLDLRVWPDRSNLNHSGSTENHLGGGKKAREPGPSDGWFGHGFVRTSRIADVVRHVLQFASSSPTEVIVCVLRYCRPASDGMIHHMDAVTVLETAFHQQLPSFRSVALHVSKTLPEITTLRAKTTANLTAQGTCAALLLTSWEHWNGSWNVTKENNPHLLRQKASSWARTLPSHSETKTTAKTTTNTNPNPNTTVASSTSTLLRQSYQQHAPNVLEFVITVDEGQDSSCWTIVRLLLAHSVRSLARQLHEEPTDGKNSNSQLEEGLQQGVPTVGSEVLSKLQGVLLDYPTKEQIRRLVDFNLRNSSC